jgi:hypothetical protein
MTIMEALKSIRVTADAGAALAAAGAPMVVGGDADAARNLSLAVDAAIGVIQDEMTPEMLAALDRIVVIR